MKTARYFQNDKKKAPSLFVSWVTSPHRKHTDAEKQALHNTSVKSACSETAWVAELAVGINVDITHGSDPSIHNHRPILEKKIKNQPFITTSSWK